MEVSLNVTEIDVSFQHTGARFNLIWKNVIICCVWLLRIKFRALQHTTWLCNTIYIVCFHIRRAELKLLLQKPLICVLKYLRGHHWSPRAGYILMFQKCL